MGLILASASPRRIELMGLITGDFKIIASDADETLPHKIHPEEAVKMLAQRKANAVLEQNIHDIVIGSDTVVALDEKILGKPVDEHDAVNMLRMLSGRTHIVYTGVCIATSKKLIVFCDKASVTFAKISDAEIFDYVKTLEPMDKAGAYAVQGTGARYIDRIEGSFHTVMGFPISMVYRCLKEENYI